jgi:hypothetical protein
VDIIQDIISKTNLTSYYNENEKIIRIQNSKELLQRAGIYNTNSKTKHIPDAMFSDNNINKW